MSYLQDAGSAPESAPESSFRHGHNTGFENSGKIQIPASADPVCPPPEASSLPQRSLVSSWNKGERSYRVSAVFLQPDRDIRALNRTLTCHAVKPYNWSRIQTVPPPSPQEYSAAAPVFLHLVFSCEDLHHTAICQFHPALTGRFDSVSIHSLRQLIGKSQTMAALHIQMQFHRHT